jgi:hypothetical protein
MIYQKRRKEGKAYKVQAAKYLLLIFATHEHGSPKRAKVTLHSVRLSEMEQNLQKKNLRENTCIKYINQCFNIYCRLAVGYNNSGHKQQVSERDRKQRPYKKKVNTILKNAMRLLLLIVLSVI